jgi:hypothetical protein
LLDPPPCLGTFDPNDTECNGSEADPLPCTWRDRCGALKTYLRRSKQGIGRWLDLESWEIRRWCDQWIEAYEIKDGLPKHETPPAPPTELRAAFDGLVLYLITNAHQIGRQFARDRLALPGELYLSDHMAKARYMAIYARAHQGHDRPFVRLRLKPRAGVVEVRLPVTAPEAAQALGVDADAIKTGRFRCKANLKAEALTGVGPRLLGLAKSGVIKLPPTGVV